MCHIPPAAHAHPTPRPVPTTHTPHPTQPPTPPVLHAHVGLPRGGALDVVAVRLAGRPQRGQRHPGCRGHRLCRLRCGQGPGRQLRGRGALAGLEAACACACAPVCACACTCVHGCRCVWVSWRGDVGGAAPGIAASGTFDTACSRGAGWNQARPAQGQGRGRGALAGLKAACACACACALMRACACICVHGCVCVGGCRGVGT